MKKRKTSFWLWFALILIIVILAISLSVVLKGTTQTIGLGQFENWAANQNFSFSDLVISHGYNGTATISGIYQNSSGNWTKFIVYTSQGQISDLIKNNPIVKQILSNAPIVAQSGSTAGSILASLLPMLLLIVIYIVFFWIFTKSAGGGAGGQNIFGMGKNRAKQTKSNVKFSDVAGIEEEKEELIELVDYLKNPQKYAAAGARAPKGVLMEGPPGTGKTLLAKAVAGEAKVSFFSISGSEFEEMFVGVGASRVREMFADAKKNAPGIIFIDEIDAVGRKRSANIGTSTNEQTLNQLLVEMDGFGTNSGVIVMAATNRADVLDPALLRPGRFDRVIQVSLPDIKEREAILKLHARDKKISDSVDWHRVAERTPGMSGAQLENVLNEAAILMIREGKTIITIAEIDEAIDRVIGGPAKKTRAMTLQDKQVVSYHESGHALVGLKLEAASKVQKVTIIPRGSAGGYTIMTPKDETIFSSKKDLYAMIAGYLGGRAAEEIMFGKENVTTGAHDDLDKATSIARRMVVQFGMSELGMTKFLTMAEESYGKIEGTYSDETAAKIDHEIQKILDQAYQEALDIIKANKKELELLAESLHVLETITAEQIDYIDRELKLPKEVLIEKARYDEEKRKKDSGEILDIDLDDVKAEEEKLKKEKAESSNIKSEVITTDDSKEFFTKIKDKYSNDFLDIDSRMKAKFKKEKAELKASLDVANDEKERKAIKEQLSQLEKSKTLISLDERSKIDGSQFVAESKTDIQKHINKLKEIAEQQNIELDKKNLRSLTKRELIDYGFEILSKINN